MRVINISEVTSSSLGRAYRVLYVKDNGEPETVIAPYAHPNIENIRGILLRMFDACDNRSVDHDTTDGELDTVMAGLVDELHDAVMLDAGGRSLEVLPLMMGTGRAIRYGDHILIDNDSVDPKLERYIIEMLDAGEYDMEQGFGSNAWNDLDDFVTNLYMNPSRLVRNRLFTWLDTQYPSSMDHGFNITEGRFTAYIGEDDEPTDEGHMVGILDHVMTHGKGRILMVRVNPRDVTRIHNVYTSHAIGCTKYTAYDSLRVPEPVIVDTEYTM